LRASASGPAISYEVKRLDEKLVYDATQRDEVVYSGLIEFATDQDSCFQSFGSEWRESQIGISGLRADGSSDEGYNSRSCRMQQQSPVP